MFGVNGSRAISGDVSLLFSSNLKHSDMELSKNREFLNSDLYHHHQQQQQHQSTGLMRYRSAPSTFFASLIDGGGGGNGGDGCDDFLNPQSSSSESETMLARLMSCTGSGDSDSHDMQFSNSIKHEMVESVPQQSNGYSTCASQMIYQPPLDHDMANHSSVSTQTAFDSSYNVTEAKTGTGNCSNLIRQSSSPAGGFSNLTIENGFAVVRDVGNFKVGSCTKNEASPSTSRLNDHMKFSSGPPSCSRFMPQIAENGNESTGVGSFENGHFGNGNDSSRHYAPSFANNSWNDPTFSSLKRNRDGNAKMFSSFNSVETENGEHRNFSPSLTHHLSLPKTSAEIAAVEKFLQFNQDSVPCKIRAKRGFATHPRSIAERMRRTRISERMRKLQDLFPNMDKQTNTADMLDLAVEYIKELQKQVKILADTRAKCTCSSNQRQKSDPTA